MTWKSSCSIASDDESSRHSFLSDCDSEFDLRPPPRYPAEKRTSSIGNKRTIGRIEPPLTRSRSKAIGKSLISPTPVVSPKSRRQSGLRRSMDSFAGLQTTLKESLPQNSFLFSKPVESTTNDRFSNFFSDGVNILTDRFENCSLDEEKVNRNCVWPSRETNSRYMRPITSSPNPFTSALSPFTTMNTSAPSIFSPLGQHQEQLWSRFRSAASELRNDTWPQPTLSNPSPFPSSTTPLVSQRPLTNPSGSQPTVSFPEPSSSLLRQRKIVTNVEPSIVQNTTTDRSVSSYSFPKLIFTLTIFIIGLVLGYLLTSTFPPSQLGQICFDCLRWIKFSFETLVKYFQSLRSN